MQPVPDGALQDSGRPAAPGWRPDGCSRADQWWPASVQQRPGRGPADQRYRQAEAGDIEHRLLLRVLMSAISRASMPPSRLEGQGLEQLDLAPTVKQWLRNGHLGLDQPRSTTGPGIPTRHAGP